MSQEKQLVAEPQGQIISVTRGDDYPLSPRSIDVQIMSLRRKLGVAGNYIETSRGVGYRFKESLSETE